MTRYPEERRAAVLAKLMPPRNCGMCQPLSDSYSDFC
jgi:hypothetical protein